MANTMGPIAWGNFKSPKLGKGPSEGDAVAADFEKGVTSGGRI